MRPGASIHALLPGCPRDASLDPIGEELWKGYRDRVLPHGVVVEIEFG